jgi:hypothetical protein
MHLTGTHPAQDLFDCGVTYRRQRNIREALRFFTEAERLGFDRERCAGARWECHMLLGDFKSAWRENDRIHDPNRLWQGESLEGKRVIVRCLHGFGDAIQFLRYAPLVKQRASKLMVETHPEMVELLRTVRGVDEVITWAHPHHVRREDWDVQIEVMELPWIFRTNIASIPVDSWLDIAPRATPRLPASSSPKVGLVWASSGWNLARCIPFADLQPLLNTSEVTFMSFQRGGEAADGVGQIVDITEGAPGIHDTAHDLLELDLLITVDTMAAHLAGALRVPVWTMLLWDADWRWMLDREDTPWYPTMRLFRQCSPDEGWQRVIQRVSVELRRFFGAPRTLDSRLHL